jgi:hypothetical protein
VAVEENPGIFVVHADPQVAVFGASRQHGVRRSSVYNHTYHPRHYGDPVREYWALLEGVTLWDVSEVACTDDRSHLHELVRTRS